MIKIAPSILASDFSKLGDEIRKVEEAGADIIHVDVMDGHYVPNITIGPPVVKSIRKVTKLPFDVHLMIENADAYIDSFADAGADIISVHPEACTHLHRTLQKIRQRGVRPAVALNPATSLSAIEWIAGEVDMILLMTVNPGFGGQAFIDAMPPKIAELKALLERRGINADIEVDGGIDLTNIGTVTKAGANVIVAGSTIFGAPDTAAIIRGLRENAYRGNV